MVSGDGNRVERWEETFPKSQFINFGEVADTDADIIWIKLNPELNASENAKKYYGKAKNEVIEQKKLQEQLVITEKNLSEAEEKLSGINAASDFKGLKTFQESETKVQTQADTLPYRLHEFQGYQIWVGKNNKSNDQMLRLSQKNDL